MPKQRQIPRLFAQRLADGSTVWHWKPSKTLRAAGFTNRKLGADRRNAMAEADRLNDEVEAWKRSQTATAPASFDDIATPRAINRVVRVSELIRRYKQSDSWTLPDGMGGLKPATRSEYDVRFRQIEHWALDGNLAVRDIDKAMIADLKSERMAVNLYQAIGILRILRLLLNFAVGEGIITTNPAAHVQLPEAPSRHTVTSWDVRAAIAKQGGQVIDLAQELGFWTVQRQADILSFGRLQWRELTNVIPHDAAILANARGKVMGFRFRQEKTGAWIDAPVPPHLHDRVEAAMADNAGGWVFGHSADTARRMQGFSFQRMFRAARTDAIDAARDSEHPDEGLIAALLKCQFRDLRRTGMVFYRDARVPLPNITALSGHAVIGKKTILDTYMPPDTAAACACVATGLKHWQSQQEHQQQA